MVWFGQGKDTIEWEEFHEDALFFKWPTDELRRGARLVIRPGQKAILFSSGAVEGVFEQPGSFDLATQIVPALSTQKSWGRLWGDTGIHAEIYFVNAMELLLPWGIRQRIMIPTPERPEGVPVGCNGNLMLEFRDYPKFIAKVEEDTGAHALGDISERIMGELSPIVAACILGGERSVALSVLIGLQTSNRALCKKLGEALDLELADFGLGVRELNILSINYPAEVQALAERDAAPGVPPAAAAPPPVADRFCPVCRRMVAFPHCPDCGTATV